MKLRTKQQLTTFALIYGTIVPSGASSWKRGKASFCRSYRGMTTAARGGRRGDVIEAKNPLNGHTVRLVVVDACGRTMRPKHGRILDLSPDAFGRLYGSTLQGSGPISYRTLKKGSGSRTGSF